MALTRFRFIVFLSIGSHFRHYWEKISNTEFKNIQKDFLVCPNNKFFITASGNNFIKARSVEIKNLKDSCIIIVSKSGNTLETISNLAVIFSKISLKDRLIFIT